MLHERLKGEGPNAAYPHEKSPKEAGILRRPHSV